MSTATPPRPSTSPVPASVIVPVKAYDRLKVRYGVEWDRDDQRMVMLYVQTAWSSPESLIRRIRRTVKRYVIFLVVIVGLVYGAGQLWPTVGTESVAQCVHEDGSDSPRPCVWVDRSGAITLYR